MWGAAWQANWQVNWQVNWQANWLHHLWSESLHALFDFMTMHYIMHAMQLIKFILYKYCETVALLGQLATWDGWAILDNAPHLSFLLTFFYHDHIYYCLSRQGGLCLWDLLLPLCHWIVRVIRSSSVDSVPSDYKLLRSNVSANRSGFGCSTVQFVALLQQLLYELC